MKNTLPAERDVMAEAAHVLLEHLPPSKAARVLSWIQAGRQDYLDIKARLFAGKSLEFLAAKIAAMDRRRKAVRPRRSRARPVRRSS